MVAHELFYVNQLVATLSLGIDLQVDWLSSRMCLHSTAADTDELISGMVLSTYTTPERVRMRFIECRLPSVALYLHFSQLYCGTVSLIFILVIDDLLFIYSLLTGRQFSLVKGEFSIGLAIYY